MCVTEDQSILRFVEPLKARLGFPVRFDWQLYLQRCPELRATITDPHDAFQHWLENGRIDLNEVDCFEEKSSMESKEVNEVVVVASPRADSPDPDCLSEELTSTQLE